MTLRGYDEWKSNDGTDEQSCDRCGYLDCRCGSPEFEEAEPSEDSVPDERDPREIQAERETAAEPRPHLLFDVGGES